MRESERIRNGGSGSTCISCQVAIMPPPCLTSRMHDHHSNQRVPPVTRTSGCFIPRLRPVGIHCLHRSPRPRWRWSYSGRWCLPREAYRRLYAIRYTVLLSTSTIIQSKLGQSHKPANLQSGPVVYNAAGVASIPYVGLARRMFGYVGYLLKQVRYQMPPLLSSALQPIAELQTWQDVAGSTRPLR